MKKFMIVVLCASILVASSAWTRAESNSDEDLSKQIKELKNQVEMLKKRIKSLEKELRLLREQNQSGGRECRD